MKNTIDESRVLKCIVAVTSTLIVIIALVAYADGNKKQTAHKDKTTTAMVGELTTDQETNLTANESSNNTSDATKDESTTANTTESTADTTTEPTATTTVEPTTTKKQQTTTTNATTKKEEATTVKTFTPCYLPLENGEVMSKDNYFAYKKISVGDAYIYKFRLVYMNDEYAYDYYSI